MPQHCFSSTFAPSASGLQVTDLLLLRSLVTSNSLSSTLSHAPVLIELQIFPGSLLVYMLQKLLLVPGPMMSSQNSMASTAKVTSCTDVISKSSTRICVYAEGHCCNSSSGCPSARRFRPCPSVYLRSQYFRLPNSPSSLSLSSSLPPTPSLSLVLAHPAAPSQLLRSRSSSLSNSTFVFFLNILVPRTFLHQGRKSGPAILRVWLPAKTGEPTGTPVQPFV